MIENWMYYHLHMVKLIIIDVNFWKPIRHSATYFSHVQIINYWRIGVMATWNWYISCTNNGIIRLNGGILICDQWCNEWLAILSGVSSTRTEYIGFSQITQKLDVQDSDFDAAKKRLILPLIEPYTQFLRIQIRKKW